MARRCHGVASTAGEVRASRTPPPPARTSVPARPRGPRGPPWGPTSARARLRGTPGGDRAPARRPGADMSLTEAFWIFVVLSALQPIVRQKLLELHRMRSLARFEQKRESRVIALIHRQETMSLLGFPLMRYIDVHDSEEVLRAIKLTDPEVPLDLLVHTPGGLVLAAGQIAKALRRHPGKVTVFVPHYAMSGGTLIALAADEIVMDPNAVLGPVDPQVGQSPAASIPGVSQRKAPNEIDDQTLILADVAQKAVRQLEATVRRPRAAGGPGPRPPRPPLTSRPGRRATTLPSRPP